MTRLFAKKNPFHSRSRRKKSARPALKLGEYSDCALRSQLRLEPLEERCLLTAVSFLDDDAGWQAEGPAPILNSSSAENISAGNPVSGAIQAVATHPTNPGIIWIPVSGMNYYLISNFYICYFCSNFVDYT